MAMRYHRYPESYDIIVVGAGHAGCELHWPRPGWALKY